MVTQCMKDKGKREWCNGCCTYSANIKTEKKTYEIKEHSFMTVKKINLKDDSKCSICPQRN